MPRTTITVPCGLCGKPLIRTPSQLKHYPNPFHKECRGKGISPRMREVALARPPRPRTEAQKQHARDTLGPQRRRQVTRPCSIPGCPETVTRKASEMKYGSVFCDTHKTQRQYVEKVKKPCETCGELTEKWPSQIRGQDHFFCGNTCRDNFPRERVEMLPWHPSQDVCAYLAGLWDGDGNIDIAEGQEKPQLRARIGLTHLPVLEWIKAEFPGTCSIASRNGTNPRHKPMWNLDLMGNQAYRFVQAIEPYLRLKRQDAQLGLALQALDMRDRSGTIHGETIRAEWAHVKERRKRPEYIGKVTPAYVAGFFDAEGSVMLGQVPKYCCLTVSISNTIKWLIDDIQEWFPYRSHIQTTHPLEPTWKDAYIWRCTTIAAWHFLVSVHPYLHIKAERVQLALQYCALYEAKQHRHVEAQSILSKFMLLNARGVNQ
jgi:hypothetical protein